MKRIAKKIAAAVLSLTLVLAVSTTCFGAVWDSYFGASLTGADYWYEGSEGSISNANAVTGFTANVTNFGWGGVWGGQVFLSNASKLVDVKKGQQYTINFDVKSSTVPKYIYVKVSTGESLAYSFWQLIPGGSKVVKVRKTFTAKKDAKTVYFGIGGDAGDREGVSTDEDAPIRYSVFKAQYKKDAKTELLKSDCVINGKQDFATASQITVSNFSVLPATTIKSAKSTKAKTVKVAIKKATTGVKKTIAGYEFKAGKKSVKKSGASAVIKGLKSGKKVKVQVRTYAKDKKTFGPWSKAKTVKVK